jgi:hypothetical protein
VLMQFLAGLDRVQPFGHRHTPRSFRKTPQAPVLPSFLVSPSHLKRRGSSSW